MTPLIECVIENVDYFCTLILPYIEWCDHTLLIICSWGVHVEVDEWVLSFELLEVFLSWLTGICRLQLMKTPCSLTSLCRTVIRQQLTLREVSTKLSCTA